MKAGPSGNNMSTDRLQFPELGWKKRHIWSPEIPRMKLTARIHPCVVWLPSFFLTNRAWRKMVAEFQDTAASCPCWRPDFQAKTVHNAMALNNHLSTQNEHNEHIRMQNARDMYSQKTLTVKQWKPTQKPSGNFPIPRLQQPCNIKTCNASQTLLRRSKISHHYIPCIV